MSDFVTCDREGCGSPATGYDAWGQWCEQHNGDENLPAPWPDVLDALRSISGANAEVFRLVEQIRERHDKDIDELRAEVQALSRLVVSLA